MEKHHIVQAAYLKQWKSPNSPLNIYVIEKNEFVGKSTNWEGFWRKDFNVLDEEGRMSYLPEEHTSIIDSKGIETIRNISPLNNKAQLTSKERSSLAFYISLQYIRTPRYREEMDKMVQATIQYLMRKDITSPDKVSLSREDILKHEPENKQEKEALEQISKMSDGEIKKQIFDSLNNNNYIAGLTTTGHSKGILKVDGLAKELFEVQWVFHYTLGLPFVTSDNPSFTISQTRESGGLLSPNSIIIFPLRPDLCISIKPSIKSKVELFEQVDDNWVQEINKLILENSYQCLVAKDETQLQELTKDFDCKNHRKSRDIVISESGPYTKFGME